MLCTPAGMVRLVSAVQSLQMLTGNKRILGKMRVRNPVHPPKACAPLDPNYNSVPSKYVNVVTSLNRLVSRVVTFVPVWIEVMFFVHVPVVVSYTP